MIAHLRAVPALAARVSRRISRLVHRPRPNGQNGTSLLILEPVAEGAIQTLHLQHASAGWQSQPVTLEAGKGAGALLRRLGRRTTIVALLPQTHYLVKVLEIPKVSPEETRAMLSLEVEAMLLPEFGEAEIACRPLPGIKDGRLAFEVYVARREKLADYLAGLGVQPDVVLPTAAAWSVTLRRENSVDLFVAAVPHRQELELAFENADQSVSVRTIARTTANGQGDKLEPGVVECIRSLLARRAGPVTIGWIGQGCPAPQAGGSVVVQPMDGRLIPTGDAGQSVPALTQVVAASLLGGAWQEECNLVPRALSSQRRQRAMYRQLAVGGICMLLGLTAMYVALQVAIFRCQAASESLARQVALVRAEGESVGQRIEQMEVIRGARASRNYFQDIILALHVASPTKGLSYSQVELMENGGMRLEGQAESLSGSFLLPQRLQEQSIFTQVAMRDSKLQQESGGSAARFRIDCRLRQAGQP